MGDERFEALIRDHARVIAAAVGRVCGRRHRELVADVRQEVHLALWKRLQSGKPIAAPASYLYKMALTTALRCVRKMGLTERSLDDSPFEPAAPVRGVAQLAPVERKRLIEEILGQLEPESRRALRAFLAGCNHREVAALYGWSESTARHRIYRSMERLASRLKTGDPGGNDDGG